MKVALVSKFGKNDEKMLEHVRVAGLDIVQENPEVAICHGGNGTFLTAERLYPGIPKLLLKGDKICTKCSNHSIEDVMQSLRKNTFKTKDQIKIKADANKKTLLAAHNIILRNKTATHALRFELKLGEEKFEEELVGDGVVVATPAGANSYYYSIAKRGFSHGLGIAFNNLTKDHDHFNFEDTKIIELKITRGEGILSADNTPETIELKEGDIFTIQKAQEITKIITLH